MKWIIASDIHGSAGACRALLERFSEEDADRLLLLGDLLYHGPRNALPHDYAPREVIDMLNACKERITCVRGNCEAEVDQMVLAFPVLAEYALIDLGDRLLFATHGHKYNRDNLPPLKKGDLLLYGHTHLPLCAEQDGILCLNPGSIALPKQDSPHAYMTLQDGCFLWKTAEGAIFDSYQIPSER